LNIGRYGKVEFDVHVTGSNRLVLRAYVALVDVLRCAGLEVAFSFSAPLAGVFFASFDAPEDVFGFVVPMASFFGLVFTEAVFFFDAAVEGFAAGDFFVVLLFAAVGFAAVAGLVTFALMGVDVAAGAFFTFGLAAGALLAVLVAGADLALTLGVMLAFLATVAGLVLGATGFAPLTAAVLVLEEDDGFTGLFSFAESPFGASLILPDRPFGRANVPLSAPVLMLRLSWLVIEALKSIP